MSGLFNKASLVLVPSGYKAGKVYSQVPTSGDGDLTFTRASDATRVNSDGEIEVVGSGVPRLDYSQGSCPSLLLEPQRTNSVLNSTMDGAVSGSPGTAPTTWAFNGGGGLTRTISLGTENGLNYIDFRFQGTATQSFVTVLPTSTGTSASATQNWNFSVYLKLVSGTIPNSRLNILASTGSTQTELITLTSTLTRFNMTYLNVPSGTTFVRPYFDTNTLVIGNSYDFTIRIAAPQLEQGAYATSYIPTTSATVTRPQDSFSKTNISSLIGQTEGVIMLDFFYDISVTTQEVLYIYNSAFYYLYRARIGANGQNILAIIYNNNSSAKGFSPNITLVPGNRYKIASVYNYATNTVKTFVNGSLVGTTVGVDPFPTVVQDKIHSGNLFGSIQYTKFNSIYLSKVLISDAEAEQLTTL